MVILQVRGIQYRTVDMNKSEDKLSEWNEDVWILMLKLKIQLTQTIIKKAKEKYI